MNSQREAQSNNQRNEHHSDGPIVSPLWEYVAILLRGKWIILASVFVVTGLAGLYALDTKPLYEASSLVLIETKPNDKAGPMFDFTGATASTKITNEIEILKSRSTLQAVAEALLSQKFINDKKTRIIPILAPGAGSRDSLATVDEVAERLSGAVYFTPIHETDIVKITASSGDPVQAALIANVYTEIYASQNLQASRLRTTAIREFLQSQLDSRKTLLDSAENNLQEYMRSSGVVSLDAEGNKVVDQLSALEAQRDAIDVDKSSRLKTLASYKEEFEKLGQSSAKTIEESNDSYISLLQEQIAKLEVQRDIVTAQNPDLVDQKLYSDKLKEIDQQIASLKKTLAGRTEEFLKSVLPGTGNQAGGGGSFLAEAKQRIIEQSIELQALDARKNALDGVIQDYEKKFNQIPKKSMDLARLQRTKMSNEKLYLLVEEKYNETAIQEKSEFGYVNIVDPAVVPVKPVGTRLRVFLVFGFIAGLTLGVFITFLWGFIDVRVRTPEDLKRHGFIPLSTVSSMKHEIKKINEDAKGSTPRSPLDVHLVSFYRPFGPIAESYRHLRTSVLATQEENSPRCIMMTSAIPGEGKTTTVCNLAISLAQAEKKVLLVNADLRRPAIHELFGLTHEKGLAGFLTGDASLEDVRQRGVFQNLDIIASGELPDNPSELLGSNGMKDFIRAVSRSTILCLPTCRRCWP